MRPTQKLSVLFATVSITVLASCGGLAAEGGHGDHGDNSPAVADARQIDVEANDFTFNPSAIEITAGDDVTVALTATDVEHDFVVDEVDSHVHAEPGETAIGGLRIDVPGIYTAYCSVPGHREAGMEATITVTS